MSEPAVAQERVVHQRIPQVYDRELHVSTLFTPYGSFTDIREYVVSLDQYGRGVTFQPQHIETVRAGLLASLTESGREE